jgi:hypothetical protein
VKLAAKLTEKENAKKKASSDKEARKTAKLAEKLAEKEKAKKEASSAKEALKAEKDLKRDTAKKARDVEKAACCD